MRTKIFIALIAMGFLICTSCNNTDTGPTAEELELQKKELELKEKELELREKELNKENTPTTTSTTTDAPFLGKWSFNNGADWMKITSQNGSFLVVWASIADGHREHEIPCTLVDGKLIGDFYGHKKNVKIAVVDATKITLTVDPFAEFAPIKNQAFVKVS